MPWTESVFVLASLMLFVLCLLLELVQVVLAARRNRKS